MTQAPAQILTSTVNPKMMTLALMSWPLINSLNSVFDQTFGGLPNYTSAISGGEENPIGLIYTLRRGIRADVIASAGGWQDQLVLVCWIVDLEYTIFAKTGMTHSLRVQVKKRQETMQLECTMTPNIWRAMRKEGNDIINYISIFTCTMYGENKSKQITFLTK